MVGNLEEVGVAVMAFVCDGSSVNRAFFQMQPEDHDEEIDTDITYATLNPFNPTREIYFIPDPPHALKTTRNALENSGRKKSRCMFKNGENLTWKTIVRLYTLKSEQTVKKLHKLTAACVYLNSYSRMSVPKCCVVISESVASQLRLLDWPDTKELSIFI